MACDFCARNRKIQKDFPDLKLGFENVTLLMQFIFLLRVALARLGSILRENKALPHTSGTDFQSETNLDDLILRNTILTMDIDLTGPQRPLSIVRDHS